MNHIRVWNGLETHLRQKKGPSQDGPDDQMLTSRHDHGAVDRAAFLCRLLLKLSPCQPDQR